MNKKFILPAIVIVGYNRPEDVKRIISYIKEGIYQYDNIPLVFSFDLSDKTEELVKIAENFDWEYGEKTIRTFPKRQGLRNHVIQCGDLSLKYGAVIILEDDLIVAKDFYNYAVQAFNNYANNERIAGVSLYSHMWNGFASRSFIPQKNEKDVFFGQIGVTWGQGWTRNQWIKFKQWYENNQVLIEDELLPEQIYRWSDKSWGKYFSRYLVEEDMYYIMPYNAMSSTCASAGEHFSQVDTTFQVPLFEGKKNYVFPEFDDDAIKYDMFFERISLDKSLDEKYVGNTTIALYGNKKCTKRYYLTTSKLDFKIEKSYMLSARPIEANVIHNLEGNGIFLYDTKIPQKNNIINDTYYFNKIKYQVQGISWKELLKYVNINIKNAIRRRIKK